MVVAVVGMAVATDPSIALFLEDDDICDDDTEKDDELRLLWYVRQESMCGRERRKL